MPALTRSITVKERCQNAVCGMAGHSPGDAATSDPLDFWSS